MLLRSLPHLFGDEVEGEAGAFGEVAGDLLAEDVGEVAGREAVSGAD